MNGERPYLVLRPRIIAGLVPKFLSSMIIFLILGVYAFIDKTMSSIIAKSTFFSIFFILMILIPLITLFFSYMNLRAREYRFFKDRIEFYEGFLNISRRVVRYDRVTDVGLRKSVWERIWSTGSVFVNTAGSPYREVHVSYIRNPEEALDAVQKLVKRYSGNSGDGTEAYKK